jgi:hypothetical protein
MMEIIETAKRFFSKSMDDLEFMAETALFVVLGPKWNKVFETPVYVPAEETEEGIPQLIMVQKICVLCTGLKPGDIDHTKLRKNSYGELLAQALNALLQMIQDYVGNELTLVVKETKCRLRGDDCNEGRVYFTPKKA